MCFSAYMCVYIVLFLLTPFFAYLFLCFVLFRLVLVLFYYFFHSLSSYFYFNERSTNVVDLHLHRRDGVKDLEGVG